MICVDCRYVRERPSGIGLGVKELIERVPPTMPDQPFLLLKHPNAGQLSDAPNVREVVVRQEANGPATMWLLPAIVDLRGVKVFHSPFNTLPRGLRMHTIVTLHDLMWMTSPQWAQSPGVWGHVERVFYQHGILRTLRKADSIVAVSNATFDAIGQVAPRAVPRTRTIMQAVAKEFRPPTDADAARIASVRQKLAHGAPRYVLAVGQFAPYKNHPGVVRAFAQAFQSQPDVHLVMVQRLGAGSMALLPLAESLGIGARLHLTSAVDLDDLIALYQGAACLCHPSLIEGYGFPLAEALASGCPVVTSNRSAMPEVCADAAEYASPESVDEIAAALVRVLGSPALAESMKARGLRRAGEFSWARYAESYVSLYREALAQSEAKAPRRAPRSASFQQAPGLAQSAFAPRKDSQRSTPLVSVIVRSYCRPAALLELVDRVRSQHYPAFEIVIFEQSSDPKLLADLEALGDPRVRVFVGPPTNPPAARNEAIRHARGELFLLLDDDDLPHGDDWIAQHVANYDDPLCMGVVGRLVPGPRASAGPRFPSIVRFFAMKYTFFKDTRSFAHNTMRKDNAEFLIGSNASLRRSLMERIGGWDEGIPMDEEQSFGIKFGFSHRPGEHFSFDPKPVIWRRTDVPGGLARRQGSDWHLRELDARLFYYRNVVGYYFPLRYRLFAPMFVARAMQHVLLWIWDPDNRHRSVRDRLRASIDVFLSLPTVLRKSRFSAGNVRRIPQWR